MRFCTKVFCSTVSVVLLSASALSWTHQRLLARHLQSSMQTQQQQLGRTLARAFTQMERASDGKLTNGLRVFREREAAGARFDGATLGLVAQELDLGCLGTFDSSGLSQVFSEDPHAAGATNIFELCPSYAQTIAQPARIILTPFAPKFRPNRFGLAAEKYAYVFSHGRTQVLAASLHAFDLQTFLQQTQASDPSILGMDLFAPNGVLMASSDPGLPHGAHKPFPAARPAMAALRQGAASSLQVVDIPATQPDCCECVGKGILPADAPYVYRLSIEQSLAPWYRMHRDMRLSLLWVFLSVLLGGFALAHAISRRLVRRLERAARMADAAGQNGSARFSDAQAQFGNDEVSQLTRSFDALLTKLAEGERCRRESERMRALGSLASQVAHDIRSPLAALHVVVLQTEHMEEDIRTLTRMAIKRITDIANNLLRQYRGEPKDLAATGRAREPALVANLVQSCISERRVLERSHRVRFTAQIAQAEYCAFAHVEAQLFRQVVANLLSNAIEALGEAGHIEVRMAADGSWIDLWLRDDGCGMAPEVLARLGEPGFSAGKPLGHGLGVAQAMRAVAGWGGTLKLDSAPGAGTEVHMRLPQRAAPAWFAHAIHLTATTQVLVLDDDAAIGQVWRRRLGAVLAGGGAQVVHCRSSVDLVQALAHVQPGPLLCLIDYELVGQVETGLDIIDGLRLADCSLLVTSHDERPEVRAACAARGLQLLPKAFAAFVPIHVQHKAPHPRVRPPKRQPAHHAPAEAPVSRPDC